MDTTMIGVTNGSSNRPAEAPATQVDSLAAGGAAPDAAREGLKIMERVFAAAHSKAVFGEPITAGAYTIITASEVSAGGGFGFGRGFGPVAHPGTPKPGAPGEDATPLRPPYRMGGGGGLGGGGGSTGRPIALIVIGPEGVKVQPVVDVTKIVLANFALTAKWLPLLLKRVQRAR